MKLEFDIIKGRNNADLGKYGEFKADYVLFGPGEPEQFKAVGTLYTMPKHAEKAITIKDATLEVDIDTLHSDPVSDNPTAEELFNKAWSSWGCYDIPEEWKY